MLEKNGSVILSAEDVASIRQGVVPPHVSLQWNLTLDELKVIVEASTYQPKETLDDRQSDAVQLVGSKI